MLVKTFRNLFLMISCAAGDPSSPIAPRLDFCGRPAQAVLCVHPVILGAHYL